MEASATTHIANMVANRSEEPTDRLNILNVQQGSSQQLLPIEHIGQHCNKKAKDCLA